MTFAELMQSYGASFRAMFVPQKFSRNANSPHKSLNWRCVIERKGKRYVTDYMQGVGHIPAPTHKTNHLRQWSVGEQEMMASNEGKYYATNSTFITASLPVPKFFDVFQSLMMDASTANDTFPDWCDNLGYDSDSREAERIYNECLKVNMALQDMFTYVERQALDTAIALEDR